MVEYNITVSRDGKFWLIEIPELDGATQARRLSEVDEMAIDFIADYTETDPSTITLHREISLPATVSEHLTRSLQFRKAEDDARKAAARESRAAVLELTQMGLTVREVGQALNISHQRVQQLVSA